MEIEPTSNISFTGLEALVFRNVIQEDYKFKFYLGNKASHSKVSLL